MNRTTESDSNYDGLDSMSVTELLTNINIEDKTVPNAVDKVIPSIARLVDVIAENMSNRSS